MDKDYKMIYCPFCKSEIKTEEIEKVKVVRKTKKEIIEIDRVIFEEVKIWNRMPIKTTHKNIKIIISNESKKNIQDFKNSV